MKIGSTPYPDHHWFSVEVKQDGEWHAMMGAYDDIETLRKAKSELKCLEPGINCDSDIIVVEHWARARVRKIKKFIPA